MDLKLVISTSRWKKQIINSWKSFKGQNPCRRGRDYVPKLSVYLRVFMSCLKLIIITFKVSYIICSFVTQILFFTASCWCFLYETGKFIAVTTHDVITVHLKLISPIHTLLIYFFNYHTFIPFTVFKVVYLQLLSPTKMCSAFSFSSNLYAE
jgi:hypothetical protein